MDRVYVHTMYTMHPCTIVHKYQFVVQYILVPLFHDFNYMHRLSSRPV